MKNTNERDGNLNTILGKDSYCEGNLNVNQTVRVDGELKGDIHTDATVIIGKDGKVTGDVTAKKLVLGGYLNGNVKIDGHTVLESSAVFHGDLSTKLLVIDEGAQFDGECSMSDTVTKKDNEIQDNYIS